ncbi:MAG TPA: DUF2721 domain-containing protein [Fibrobacteria bacterium]|mgnify:CR=1 FL=1|nr:DUF2721 domain-containing protein [Fibrobacteria bacterium]
MELTISTPALLFPTVSLLMLAYTNRFLGLAAIIRKLHADWKASPDPIFLDQIQNLRRRLRLIRDMQTMGILALLLCVVCMILLLMGLVVAAKWVFGASLALMTASLGLSLVEIQLSGGALSLHLRDIESNDKK